MRRRALEERGTTHEVVADLKPFVRRPASFVPRDADPAAAAVEVEQRQAAFRRHDLAVVAETDERGSGLGSQARRAAGVLDLGAEQRRRQRLGGRIGRVVYDEPLRPERCSSRGSNASATLWPAQ